MKGRFYIMAMEGKYINQQEKAISKEVKTSVQTQRSQDFVRLECEGTHKELKADHKSEAEPSQSIVASQEQRVHEVGLVDHSQESHDHYSKEKLEGSIAKHFKDFIGNFRKIEKEVNKIGLQNAFSTYKREMGELHGRLAYSLKEANFAEADKCIKECEARKRAFETSLKERKFENDFKTTIVDEGNGRFFVESTAKRGSGFFQNIIDVGKGQIIGINNQKCSTKNWHLSDVVYNQLQSVLKETKKDISQFDLKSWYGKNIVNESTQNMAEVLLGADQEKTFKVGSNEFNVMKKTATAKSKFYLLSQHPEAFRGKQVTSITIRRTDDDKIEVNYEIGS